MKKMFLAAAAASVMISGMAFAAADIYISGGAASGFVGKGDVQTTFGLNNAQIQKVHTEVKFDLDMSYDAGSYVCVWTTGEGTRGEKEHRVTKKMKGSLFAALSSTDRKTGQWTGWNITGGNVEETGDGLKEAGDSCLGNGTGGTVESVSEDAGGMTGGLYATINGDRRQVQTAVIYN